LVFNLRTCSEPTPSFISSHSPSNIAITLIRSKPDRLAWLVAIAFRREFPQSLLGSACAQGIGVYRKLLRAEGGSIAEDKAAKRLGITHRELKN
jgi:hypothetical protein